MEFCGLTQHLAVLLVLWSFAAFETLSTTDQQCKGESFVVHSLTRYKKSEGSKDGDTRVAAFRSRMPKYKSRIYNEIKWGRILTAGISSVCQLKMLALHAASNDLDLSSRESTWTVLSNPNLKLAVTQLSNELSQNAVSVILKHMSNVQLLQSQKDGNIKEFYEFMQNKGDTDFLRDALIYALDESIKITEIFPKIESSLNKTKIIVKEIWESLDKIGSKAEEAKKLVKNFCSELEVFSQTWASLFQWEQFQQQNIKILNTYLLTQYSNLLELIDLPETSINETVRETIFETQMYPFEHPIAIDFLTQIRGSIAENIQHQLENGALATVETDVESLVVVEDAEKNENFKNILTKNCEERMRNVEDSVGGWDIALQKLLDSAILEMKDKLTDYRQY